MSPHLILHIRGIALVSPHLIVHIRGGIHLGFNTKNRRFDSIFRFLLQGGVVGVEGQYIYNIKLLRYSYPTVLVGSCHHGMARPEVADSGTASDKEGSCE